MREALQGLEQVLVTTTVKITSDLQNNLFSMVDYVKVLGLEQEKLTEKVTLQSQQSQDLVQLSNDVREMKAQFCSGVGRCKSCHVTSQNLAA